MIKSFFWQGKFACGQKRDFQRYICIIPGVSTKLNKYIVFTMQTYKERNIYVLSTRQVRRAQKGTRRWPKLPRPKYSNLDLENAKS